MRQSQFGRMRPTLTQQEPTARPTVNRAGTLAGIRLRDPDDESLRVAQQYVTGPPAIEFYLTSSPGCLITAPYGRCARVIVAAEKFHRDFQRKREMAGFSAECVMPTQFP